MLKTILALPDGSLLSSGEGTVDAIASITLTQCVNDSGELNPGSVCAAMLEAKIITPGGGVPLQAGEEVHLYREEDGVQQDLGLFILQQPTRPSANILSFTAYDRVSLLDRDLTDWLAGLTGWPYRLADFAALVCQACGLELETADFPNWEFSVPAFTAQGVTGRQLISWAAQAAGRFCRATPAGTLEFAWYTPTDTVVGPAPTGAAVTEEDLLLQGADAAAAGDGLTLTGISGLESEGDLRLLTGQRYYFMGGLQYEDYTVAPIEKVQVRLTGQDVGAVYPDTEEEANTYAVTGNYLLTASFAQALEPVAETLYEQLRGAEYTPCAITMPAGLQIRAGDIITVVDPNGRPFTAWVMSKVQAGQKDTLTCTGSHRRDSSAAVNYKEFKAVTGKVLELQADIQGLRAENRDAAGNLAAVELTLEGIATQVEQQQARTDSALAYMTQVEQDAQSLSVQVRQLTQQGASRLETAMGYTFDDSGLRIEKTGEAVSTVIDHRGMEVSRSGETVLQATAEGVQAIDIRVKNYLVVGSHARFEDYTDGVDSSRAACFYI